MPSRHRERGGRDTGRLPPGPYRHPVLYGWSCHLVSQRTTPYLADIAAMAASGMNALRTDLNWDQFETSPGSYDPTRLARLSAIAQTAASYGMRALLVTLVRSPGFRNASNGAYGGFLPPLAAHIPAYARLAADVAGLLRGVGLQPIIEVWNEPTDGSNFWQGWNGTTHTTGTADPATYAAMVQQVYSAVKTVNPDALVIAGVMPSLFNTQQTYLQNMFKAGALGYMDGLAHHPYASSQRWAPDDAVDDATNNLPQQLATLRSLAAAAGWTNAPLYLTEYGWASTYWPTPSGKTAGVNYFPTDEGTRGTWYSKAVAIAAACGDVRGLFAYTHAQTGNGGSVAYDTLAMLDGSGSATTSGQPLAQTNPSPPPATYTSSSSAFVAAVKAHSAPS